MQPFSPIDTASEAIVRTASEIWTLFKIYWLPWLLGTCALIAIAIVFAEQFSGRLAPGWLENLVWAPFAAMIEVLILRLILRGDRPERGINLEVSRVSAIVAAVLFVSWLPELGWDAAQPTMIVAIIGDAYLRTEDFIPIFYTFLVAKWLMNGLVTFAIYGLVAVAVDLERFDFAANLRFICKRPLKLFLLVCVARTAIGGLELLYAELVQLLGISKAYAYPDPTMPRRDYVLAAFLWHLGQFPLDFLKHGFQVVLLGIAYRRLMGVQAERSI